MNDPYMSPFLKEETLSAVLDLMTVSVIVVGRTGHILHVNTAARELLACGKALVARSGVLCATDREAAAELRNAVAAVADGPRIAGQQSGRVVPLGGTPALGHAAWVLPLACSDEQRRTIRPARAAVFVRELGEKVAFSADLLAKRYGITNAEGRVLTLLMQGMSMQEASAALGVSPATVKTHVNRLFDKTGTSRQPELLLLAMSAWMPAQSMMAQ